MSRVIKFRAWDGNEMWHQHPHNNYFISKYLFSPDDSVVLMQFTGLLDRNGKEIYESDIVRIHIDTFDRCKGIKSDFVVVIEDGDWGDEPRWRHIEGSGYECSTLIMSGHEDIDGCNYGVIGNIHQNPELVGAWV